MRPRILMFGLILLIEAVQLPAQLQPKGLWLSDVQIGLDKQAALSGLKINYEVTPIPGLDGYLLVSKSSKDEIKGQVNFSAEVVASVSEQIGGPYLDGKTMSIVRDLHRLLSPYGRRTSEGGRRISIELQFHDQKMAGVGDAADIYFKVDTGREIHLGFIAPDDPNSGSPSAYLSIFRNAP